jgi:hypothetical protein
VQPVPPEDQYEAHRGRPVAHHRGHTPGPQRPLSRRPHPRSEQRLLLDRGTVAALDLRDLRSDPPQRRPSRHQRPRNPRGCGSVRSGRRFWRHSTSAASAVVRLATTPSTNTTPAMVATATSPATMSSNSSVPAAAVIATLPCAADSAPGGHARPLWQFGQPSGLVGRASRGPPLRTAHAQLAKSHRAGPPSSPGAVRVVWIPSKSFLAKAFDMPPFRDRRGVRAASGHRASSEPGVPPRPARRLASPSSRTPRSSSPRAAPRAALRWHWFVSAAGRTCSTRCPDRRLDAASSTSTPYRAVVAVYSDERVDDRRAAAQRCREPGARP